MSSKQHSETDRPQTQKKQGVGAWIKPRIIAIMDHRYFDKIATIVGLLLTALGVFSFVSWYTSTSKTSGANSPSVSGNHNNVSTTINNTTINKTVIVNSREEAEEDLFRTMGRETRRQVIHNRIGDTRPPSPELMPFGLSRRQRL